MTTPEITPELLDRIEQLARNADVAPTAVNLAELWTFASPDVLLALVAEVRVAQKSVMIACADQRCFGTSLSDTVEHYHRRARAALNMEATQ